MPTVIIDEQGCRGCTLCVDICPVDVFEQEEGRFVAEVKRTEDCIGCLSCVYVCPSRAVDVTDVELLRPFHRIEKNSALVDKLLQAPTQKTTMDVSDWEEAFKDVGARLVALGDAVTETMGRGQRAVGRKAGGLAASHMPEMYEAVGLEEVIARMQKRFAHAFDFEFEVSEGEEGKEVSLTFHRCALAEVVEGAGQEVGNSVLCSLFHEYWAGLVGSFAEARYRCDMGKMSIERCGMKLTPR